MIRRLHILSGRIHEEVCRRGYDAIRGHFVDYCGSNKLDASLLLLPLGNFLPVDDPRMAATIAGADSSGRDQLRARAFRADPAAWCPIIRSPPPWDSSEHERQRRAGVLIACNARERTEVTAP